MNIKLLWKKLKKLLHWNKSIECNHEFSDWRDWKGTNKNKNFYECRSCNKCRFLEIKYIGPTYL